MKVCFCLSHQAKLQNICGHNEFWRSRKSWVQALFTFKESNKHMMQEILKEVPVIIYIYIIAPWQPSITIINIQWHVHKLTPKAKLHRPFFHLSAMSLFHMKARPVQSCQITFLSQLPIPSRSWLSSSTNHSVCVCPSYCMCKHTKTRTVRLQDKDGQWQISW